VTDSDYANCGNCKKFQTPDCGSVNSATGRPLVETDIACSSGFEIIDNPVVLEEHWHMSDQSFSAMLIHIQELLARDKIWEEERLRRSNP